MRRPFLYDRYIFVTVDLLKLRTRLQEQDYQRLAQSLTKMREKHGFVLPAWVFPPDQYEEPSSADTLLYDAYRGKIDDMLLSNVQAELLQT